MTYFRTVFLTTFDDIFPVG